MFSANTDRLWLRVGRGGIMIRVADRGGCGGSRGTERERVE